MLVLCRLACKVSKKDNAHSAVKPGSHMICNDRRRSAARGRRPSPIVPDHMGTIDTVSATVGDERSG